MAPPLAVTPLTVSNSLFVSNFHTIVPSLAEYARTPPSCDPEKTSPGIAVSAAPCAALHPRALPHNGASAGFDQTSRPVSIVVARMPPGALRGPLTPK